ncbi:CRTAC1 family protein [Tabrizicola sp.]|uniref:CRTAC1 family protein n=1 Tax=Tabrizicola sp. TaxID=2005166 RepID=UPI0026220B79|nr:CRTAC1 family protein [Tabrizicola sp.]MDM7930446.1 CRTAC1 family protein [Tabrizicola sp.]
MIRALVFLAMAGPLAAEPVVPVFADETASSGIDTIYEGDWEYMVGGGVASFDCSGDRFPDLFVSGGAGPSALYINRSAQGGQLVFEKTDELTLDAAIGAYPLDIDSDGVMDLVVLRLGENRLYRGLGDCRFEDATTAWGFDGGDAWSTAFAAIWERGADWPTLAIGNYLDRYETAFPWGSCTDNWLHRPQRGPKNAAMGFAPPLPLTPSFCALSLLFTDWNRSGHPSLRVSNDREYYKGGQEQLWHLEPGQPPRLYTEGEGWNRLRIWGMGIASADINRDGFPDYYLTSMADNKLQVLTNPADGVPVFSDIAFRLGLTAHRPYIGDDLNPSTAWHPQFADVNNDGLLDLFVAKGNVARMPDFAAMDPNNLLLQRADGTFVEAGDRAGVGSFGIARGAQLVDFNLDGRLDLVVVNRWTTAEIWRSAGDLDGNWLQLRLHQPGTNRDAIGAVIEIRRSEATERHEITSGGGHVSGSSGWLHFGLGNAEQAELRVIWPEGKAGDWQALDAGTFQILRPDQPPVLWQPD